MKHVTTSKWYPFNLLHILETSNFNNNFIFQKVTLQFYIYKYTNVSYLKEALGNKHDIQSNINKV